MTNTHELISSLFNHSLATFRHSCRVADMLYSFGNYLDLGNDENLFLTGVFHDIGKLRIAPSLLNKTESLTEQEYSEIKKHAYYGKQILEKIHCLPKHSSEIILYHHENVDGPFSP